MRPPLTRLSFAMVGLLFAASVHARPGPPQSPETMAPYLTVPANGAVLAFFPAGNPYDLDAYQFSGNVNDTLTAVSVSEVGPDVARIELPNLAPGDRVGVRVEGGEIEVPWVWWSVVEDDLEPPAFLSEPVVTGVRRPEDVYWDAFPDRAVVFSVSVDVQDNMEVVALGTRDNGAIASLSYPFETVGLWIVRDAPGVACVELVAFDAAWNEATTELCIPVPSPPGWEPDPVPDDVDEEPATTKETADDAASGVGCAAMSDLAPASALLLFALARRRRRRPPVRSSLGARHFD